MSVAARICGYKHKRTIIRAAADGRILLYRREGWWHVSRAALATAPILTAGRVAKLAKCSTKTVVRRVKSRLIRPHEPARLPYGVRRPRRFTLADVAKVKKSLRRVVFGRRL